MCRVMGWILGSRVSWPRSLIPALLWLACVSSPTLEAGMGVWNHDVMHDGDDLGKLLVRRLQTYLLGVVYQTRISDLQL